MKYLLNLLPGQQIYHNSLQSGQDKIGSIVETKKRFSRKSGKQDIKSAFPLGGFYAFIATLIISGCSMEPKYETPPSSVELKEAGKEKSIKDVSWKEYFTSPELQNLIQKALENNRDLKLAILNIETTKLQYGISNATTYPQLSANGQYYRTNNDYLANPKYLALLTATYEIDLFGSVASARKSAIANMLASEDNKKTVQISLISQVVAGYLEYLSTRDMLALAQQAYKLQETQAKIVKSNYENGAAAMTDVINADNLLLQAKINLQSTENALVIARNALTLLIGIKIEDILATKPDRLENEDSLDGIKIAENLLEDLPSSNLLLRPDIKAAERKLIGANADIGAARAAFFPSISLSGSAGYASNDLSNLFSNKFWVFNPQINIPIFSGMSIKSKLDIAKITKNTYVVQYEQAIQNAFFESMNAFEARKTLKSSLDLSVLIAKSQSTALEITKTRYENGIDSLQTLVNANLSWIMARQTQISTHKDYLISLINLYKALGGGSAVDSAPSL